MLLIFLPTPTSESSGELWHRESIHHTANNAIELGGVKHSPLEYGVV